MKLTIVLTVCLILVHFTAGSNDAENERTSSPETQQFREWDFIKESLRGSIFRVYGMNYPPVYIPFVINMNNTTKNASMVAYRGLGTKASDYLAQHYDLIIEYVHENPSEVAEFGQIQALINAVANEKADVCMFGLTPTLERAKKLDLTSPSFWDSYRIMVKWPEETSRLTLVAKPFDSTTWWMIFVSFTVLVGMLTLFVYFRHGPFSRDSTMVLTQIMGDKIMYVVGIASNHGRSISYRSRLSLRIIMGLWLLMMIVLVNSYTSVLTAYMAVPKLNSIPQTLEELAISKEYKVSVQKNQLLADAFLNSSSGAYKMLGDTLRQNPELLYAKFTQAVEIVLNVDAANVDATMSIAFRTGADLKSNEGKCRLAVSNPISHTQSYSVSLPKNSRFTIALNEDMWRLMEYGLYDYWKREYVRSVEKCNSNPTGHQKKSQGKAPNKPIRLIELSSAFLILGVGLSLSFFVFLMERVIHMGIKIMNQRNIIIV